MQRLFPFFFLLATMTASAGVGNALWTFADFTTNAVAVRRVTIKPLYPYGVVNGSVIASDAIVRQTTTNGTLLVTNIIVGYAYRVTLSGPLSDTVFTNSFPTNLMDTTFDAHLYISASTNLGPTSLAYSQASADAKFATIDMVNGGGISASTATNIAIKVARDATNTLAARVQWGSQNLTNWSQLSTNALSSGGAFTTNFNNIHVTNNVDAGGTISGGSFRVPGYDSIYAVVAQFDTDGTINDTSIAISNVATLTGNVALSNGVINYVNNHTNIDSLTVANLTVANSGFPYSGVAAFGNSGLLGNSETAVTNLALKTVVAGNLTTTSNGILAKTLTNNYAGAVTLNSNLTVNGSSTFNNPMNVYDDVRATSFTHNSGDTWPYDTLVYSYRSSPGNSTFTSSEIGITNLALRTESAYRTNLPSITAGANITVTTNVTGSRTNWTIASTGGGSSITNPAQMQQQHFIIGDSISCNNSGSGGEGFTGFKSWPIRMIEDTNFGPYISEYNFAQGTQTVSNYFKYREQMFGSFKYFPSTNGVIQVMMGYNDGSFAIQWMTNLLYYFKTNSPQMQVWLHSIPNSGLSANAANLTNFNNYWPTNTSYYTTYIDHRGTPITFDGGNIHPDENGHYVIYTNSVAKKYNTGISKTYIGGFSVPYIKISPPSKTSGMNSNTPAYLWVDDGRVQVGTPVTTSTEQFTGTNSIVVYDRLAYNVRYIMANFYNSSGGVTTLHVDNGVGAMDVGVLSDGTALVSGESSVSLEIAGGYPVIKGGMNGATVLYLDLNCSVVIDPNDTAQQGATEDVASGSNLRFINGIYIGTY